MLRLGVVLACLFAGAALAEDGDRDGLSDDLENALLAKFTPSFRISATDCDVSPAEFAPGLRQPQVVAKNGTIYGQVFPAGAFIEIHYYHLWSRDCGRMGHGFDVEHVSVLVNAESRAVYWYASAHQDTVCDVSSGARACALDAEDGGPIVWISRGKHGSFLSRDACARGCGGDRCEEMVTLAISKLINIGEPGAALNGAVWADSGLWSLAAKMKTDFGETALAQLDGSPRAGVIPLNASRRSAQAVISAAGAPVDALQTGNRHTGSALSLASVKADRALDTGFGTVGKQIKRGRRAVAKWMRIK